MSAKGKISEAVLKFRKKQKRGAIMKPSTFQKIKESSAKRYGSEKSGQEAAGRAYWNTVMSKFRKSHGSMMGG